MRIHTKNLLKKQRVRNIIFGKKFISRKELAALSGLNYRTIIRYTQELADQHLITVEKHIPDICYRSNSEHVFFIGITLIMNKLHFTAMDINAQLLYVQTLPLPQDVTQEKLLCECSAMIRKIKECCPGKVLFGIGFNESRYLQPVHRLNTFHVLPRLLKKEFCVHTEYFDNDALILWKYAKAHLLNGRIGAFIPGDRINFALLEDGEISSNAALYLEKFRHWRVDASHDIYCTCGKRGCVNGTLTYAGLIARYNIMVKSQKKASVSAETFIGNMAAEYEAGDPLARKFYEQICGLLVSAIIKLKKDLNLDHLFLCLPHGSFFELTAEMYRKVTGLEFSRFYFLQSNCADSIIVPAEFIRDQMLKITKE